MLADVSRPVDPAVGPGKLVKLSIFDVGCVGVEVIWQFCLGILAGSNKKVLNARDLAQRWLLCILATH